MDIRCKIYLRLTNISVSGVVFLAGLCLFSVLFISGCGDFFALKPTEMESLSVLKDLQQVRENPHIENELPEMYLQPPSRINIAGGVKLFYFTRHHPAAEVARLLTEQLGFKVVPNPSTNQVVVYCADDAAADKAVEYLEMIDVPPIQVNIDCLILQRFGDVTMDWETSVMIENFLGEEVTLGESRGTFNSSGILTGLDPAFPGASLREEARSTFGLDFGYWIDENVPGHQVRTVVDVLESRGYLKILLNPTLETVNGMAAKVTLQDNASYEEIQTGKGGTSDVYSITKYTWIADSLEVTPSVYADGYIGLKTDIKVSSRSKPEGVTQKAIITERAINVAENRIQPGRSLIIGGMRKAEKRSVVRGVPLLRDIPLLGIFFSSKDFEEKGDEIIFILTPSISSGGKPYEEVAADIRRKHSELDYDPAWADILSDPLGSEAYTDIIEKEATKAEVARVKAELQKMEAEKKADTAREATEKAREEINRLKAETEKAVAEARAALAEAEEAKAAAAASQQLGEQEKQKAAQALAEKEKAATEAQVAKEAALSAQQQGEAALEKAKAEDLKAQQALERIKKAHAETEKARAEAKAAVEAKAKAEAEAKTKAEEAEAKAKAEAEAKAKAEAEAKKAADEAAKESQEQPTEENQSQPEEESPQPVQESGDSTG